MNKEKKAEIITKLKDHRLCPEEESVGKGVGISCRPPSACFQCWDNWIGEDVNRYEDAVNQSEDL